MKSSPILFASALLGISNLASGALTYTENFSDTGSSVSAAGWQSYLRNNSGGITDTSGFTQASGLTSGYVFLYPDTPAGGFNSADGPGLFFTTEPTGVLDSTAIGDLMLLSVSVRADGSVADPAIGRFAIRIGSQWYASTSLATPQGTVLTNPTWSTYSLNSGFTDGTNWLTMTATAGGTANNVTGGTITLGSAASGTLSGDITAWGIYVDNGDGGDHFRIDNFTINSIPEPSSAGLAGLGGLGLLLRRRRK